MIVLSRIDNRLIHGQVIEAWLPHLHVQRVVVADDEAADDVLAGAAMTLAMPEGVAVSLLRVEQVNYSALAADGVRTLLLFRDVAQASVARAKGLPNGVLNVGNVHAGNGRAQLTRSVFLSDAERAQLQALQASGMTVSVQAVPSEKSTSV